MDQKANSVADIAAVLKQQEEAPRQVEEDVGNRRPRPRSRSRKGGSPPAGKNDGPQTQVEAQDTDGTEGVKIRWSNILDAQFAETWPASVIHDNLTKDRYAAAAPMVSMVTVEPPADVPKAEAAETVPGP